MLIKVLFWVYGNNILAQHYGKSWLCYSDHIKTWLSKDRPFAQESSV